MAELAPAAGGLLRQGFAGDTFNTAWYLRRCLPAHWQVDYLTAVGDDALSHRMTAFIAGAGIGTAHVACQPGTTVGLYLITLNNGERSFTYWRGQSAARQLAVSPQRLLQGLNEAAAVVFSGITLAILDAEGRANLAQALAVTRAAGAIVVFDPNMRRQLWPDAQALRAAVTFAAVEADIVLPSFDEDQAVFGDHDPAATLTRYRSLGAPTVVVKNGAGVVLGWDGALHRHAPAALRPVDTTAAGDSFNAGFLAAHLTGASLPAAMAQGAALAGQVILHPGALVPVDPPFHLAEISHGGPGV